MYDVAFTNGQLVLPYVPSFTHSYNSTMPSTSTLQDTHDGSLAPNTANHSLSRSPAG